MDKKYLESSEFYSKRFNNFSTLIIIPMALIVLAFFIFSFFGKREITIEGMGTIEPKQAVPVIQSSSANIIKQNYLHEGQLVKKNDVLLTYNSSTNEHKLEYYEQQKNDFKAQKRSLDLLKNSINKNQDLFTSDDNFGYRCLLKDYLAQRSVLLTENKQIGKQTKDTTTNTNYAIQENNDKLASLQMQELEKVNQEQIENHQKAQELAANIKDLIDVSKTNAIKAPKTGVLHINEQYQNNQYIPTGTEIAEVYPILIHQQTIQLKSYISTADISSVKKGQKIRFKITRNIPKPIVITGTIKNISVSPISIGKESAYLVKSSAKISTRTSRLLHYGMVGTTSIITGKKTFFDYYKDKLLNKN